MQVVVFIPEFDDDPEVYLCNDDINPFAILKRRSLEVLQEELSRAAHQDMSTTEIADDIQSLEQLDATSDIVDELVDIMCNYDVGLYVITPTLIPEGCQ